MVRVSFLGLIFFLYINTCFAQLSPIRQAGQTSSQARATTAQSKYSAEEERIIAEINSSGMIKNNSAKESLLEAAKQFFTPLSVQVKYATLLQILPGMLTNVKLLEAIDDWYGTRYRYGGTSKSGIDCSAFVRAVYKVAFGIDLPRTAREQFNYANEAISTAYLKAGDLLFFNTRGGVSHVGVYLGNNKFVHASSSHGVTVSGLNEKYYSTRYLGAKRIDRANSESEN
ncbi:MAG TPA: C40 family peptidase [Niabella sp.]|nr:C40 family peptidase [Niabella sp.]HOZ95410.1 C40 family peptidase [Niabella sp.]HQW14299.1 C40 family peptidase [Niabella sp.]HQX18421.1 C40 family peptidase [Niabella sp.]HQX40087.1 C40 family peptidase [Niabella sp.]